ncbi:tripartite motif-containing protein 2-like [Dysidea avara]|uniref:tripartite motif-containing protein 2-like n=1 Tax=Dysidea avara TaxID=196820 RepID=UPI00332EA855
MAVEPVKDIKVAIDNLTCPVCYQLYNNPKYLPCHHSYCQACLEKIQVQSKILCPECRTEAAVPEGGVKDLPSNFFINRLVDDMILKRKAKGETEAQCDECDDETVVAYCPECNMFYCDACYESHKRSKRYRGHDIVPLTELRSKKDVPIQPKAQVPVCQKHDMGLFFYCETCEELICVYCTVKDHAGHKHDSVKEIAGTAKREFNDISNLLDDMIVGISTAQRNVNDMQEKITQKGTELDKRIDKHYDKLFQRLMEQKKEVKLRLADVLFFKKKAGSFQMEELESGKTEMLKMKELTAAVDSSSDQEFLSARSQLVDHMLQLQTRYEQLNIGPTEKDTMEFTLWDGPFPQFGKLQSTSDAVPYNTTIWYLPGYALKGHRVQFEVVTRDSCNCLCFRGGSTVSVQLEATSKKVTLVEVKDKNDGSYFASFMASQVGEFNLIICVDGHLVKKAPFTVHKNFTSLNKGSKNKTIDLDGRIGKPWKIAFNDHTGMCALSDYSNYCVYVFDNQGCLVKELGGQGSEDGQFDGPQGIAFDCHNHLYIADFNNHRIQKFDSHFAYLQQFGKEAAGNEEFGPVAITVHDNRLYVADSNNQCISVFLTDGFFCLTFGSGALGQPFDVAVDANNHILVADSLNHCVCVFRMDGIYVSKFGTQGRGELNGIHGLATNPYGFTIVTDSLKHCVMVYDKDGNYVHSFGVYGSGKSQFKSPCGVAISPNGSIYIADCGNSRLQVFPNY